MRFQPRRTIIHRWGRTFSIWQAPLREELPHVDGTSNPLLWFVRELATREMVVAGVRTKEEAIRGIAEWVEYSRRERR